MTDRLDLPLRYRDQLEALLHEYVPDAEVWAYGSRVNGQSHPGSDLDLVIRSPTLELLGAEYHNLIRALEQSNIPILVQAHDWARLPETFHQKIEQDYVILQQGTDRTQKLVDIGMKITLAECAKLVRETVSPSPTGDSPYIGLQHIEEGTLCLLTHGLESDVKSTKLRFRRGDILFGKLRPYFRKVVKAPFDGICSTDIWVIRATDLIDQDYLYYRVASQNFVDFVSAGSVGTRMPRAQWEHASLYEFTLPSLDEQRAMASILRTLDNKIELNRRMSQSQEKMAQALFKSWFVDFHPVHAKRQGRWQPGESLPGLPTHLHKLFPDRLEDSELGLIPEGWRLRSLTEIGDFLNGLALQKYPPSSRTESLPVIKIAELRNGISGKSDRASDSVPDKYIVRDGDFLFSWSGSLIAKYWTDGKGALNQHLFKVTSSHYPSWFLAGWVRYHLAEFQRIASSKATTMGHIRRAHLDKARTICPPEIILCRLSSLIEPLVEGHIQANLESRVLVVIRDLLLSRLVSRQLRIRPKAFNAKDRL